MDFSLKVYLYGPIQFFLNQPLSFLVHNENCNNVTKLCHDFGNDFQEALELNEQYPNQLLFLRYEQ